MPLLSLFKTKPQVEDTDARDRKFGYDQGWEDARTGLQNEFAWNSHTAFSQGYRLGWTQRNSLISNF